MFSKYVKLCLLTLIIAELCSVLGVCENVTSAYSEFEHENSASTEWDEIPRRMISRGKPTSSSRHTPSSSRRKSTTARPNTFATSRGRTTERIRRTTTERFRRTTTAITRRPTTTHYYSSSSRPYPYPTATRPWSITTRSTWRPPTTKPRPIRTTTRPRTTTKPPKMKWKLPKHRYEMLFGGLAGTAVGVYLGYHIGQIDWEADVPAYGVQHYWHKEGYPLSNHTVVNSASVTACSTNANFCLPGTMTMCLSSGKIHCVIPEYATVPCTNSTTGLCAPSTLKLPCEKMASWGCFFTGWRYEHVQVPCMRFLRVLYREPTTKYNEKFFIPYSTTKTTVGNTTCKCNTTQLPIHQKINVTCIKLNESNTERILCSGLDLFNNTRITMDTILNATNSKNITCLPNLIPNSESVLNIFTAHRLSTLSKCEIINGTNRIDMACGFLGNLTNSNVTIPIDPNVIALNCEMRNSTFMLYEISSAIGNSNATCSCNGISTSIPGSGILNVNATGVYSVRFCISVTANPTKLYTNKEYMEYLNKDPDERKEARDKLHQFLSKITYYIWF